MMGNNAVVRPLSPRSHLAVLAAYLALALLLTYPLLLHFTTHVPGDGGDDPALAWNLWWVPHALIDLGTSPIYTDALFFPIGLNLGFYTLTYLNAFLALPIQFGFGVIPAANVNVLLSFALSGFGAFLLVYDLLSHSVSGANSAASRERESRAPFLVPAAFLAGLVYAFSSNKFLYAALGQFNIASSQWIPFYLLFLFKLLPPRSPAVSHGRYWLPGFLLGFFLLAQALSEFIFASFLILFTLAYLVYWFIARRRLPARAQLLGLVLAAPVFVVPMTPILAAMLSDTLAEGDFIQQGLGFSNIFSTDLLGFVVPSHLHPLFGGLEAQTGFPYFNFGFIGFVTLALAILALVKFRAARMWGIWAALVALITLGPTLRINGAEFDLPLPFDVLLEIPLIKGNRYPSRWSVLLTLFLAILVGYGALWLLTRVQLWLATRGEPRASLLRTLAPTALGGLILFEHFAVPLPLSDLRVPEVYAQLRNESGTSSVMELPLAWRNGFRVTGSYRPDSQGPIDRIFMYAQFYQTAHGHPILNGNTSRNPELKFQYFAETPVLNSLIAVQTGHTVDDATRAKERALAPQLLQFFGTQLVVWHAPYEEANRAVAERTRTYVEEVFPVTKISESYEDGRGVIAYRVNPLPPPAALELTPRAPLARLYLAEGWSELGGEQFWVQRHDARLLFPAVAGRAVQLTLRDLVPYPSSGQTLTLTLNGQRVATFDPLPIRDGALTAQLPAGVMRDGINELVLSFGRLAPLANANQPLSIVVRSAGEEQGAFGHIYVNGRDESPNLRGYNIVVVDPRTGAVQARGNFDTFASGRESNRLTEFLAGVAEGDLVAAAASDEASTHLTPPALDALRAVGARYDLRAKFRWSHALLGVKGAPPGSASEALSETTVSQVFLNAPLTEPNVAARIGAIELVPLP